MTDIQTTNDNPINGNNLPTGEKPKRAYNGIKKAKNPTEKNASNQNKVKQSDLLKWTVFVSAETKAFCGKAVEKSGLTIMQWVDSRLQQVARDEVGTKAQPPAKPEEIADIVKQFTERFEASQAATSQAQNDLIAQQAEQLATLTQTVKTLANRPQPTPPTFREMIFGRKKED